MRKKHKKSEENLRFLSGWQDSNLRPPHPKCGAIPGYATPRFLLKFYKLLKLILVAERAGFEPAIHLNSVWRFSKPLVSASHPSLLDWISKGVQMYKCLWNYPTLFHIFFWISHFFVNRNKCVHPNQLIFNPLYHSRKI